MNVASIQLWIDHPEELNRHTLYELRTLLVRFPYCQTLRLLYLKNLYILRDESFGDELRRSVYYVTDRRVLFYLIEGDKYLLPKHKREEEPGSVAVETEELTIDRTMALIEAFLAEMPTEEPQPGCLDYSVDYSAYLLDKSTDAEQEIDVPQLRGQGLIDKFIETADADAVFTFRPLDEATDTPSYFDALSPDEEAPLEDDEDTPVISEDDTSFTETLAMIYVKQHRYEKALEIIKKLSLKYPKKNVYFADQIRFLEKLIINAKS